MELSRSNSKGYSAEIFRDNVCGRAEEMWRDTDKKRKERVVMLIKRRFKVIKHLITCIASMLWCSISIHLEIRKLQMDLVIGEVNDDAPVRAITSWGIAGPDRYHGSIHWTTTSWEIARPSSEWLCREGEVAKRRLGLEMQTA